VNGNGDADKVKKGDTIRFELDFDDGKSNFYIELSKASNDIIVCRH
jgi:hypothetical protein